MKLKTITRRMLVIALYSMPIIFFAIVYFLQSVSSEDIYQGAGQPISILADINAAFHWNARLGDMYAWPAINFFDYTYDFGIDTIFRLIDVVMAVAIFYLITAFALGRRPRLKTTDSVIFGISFLVVFLSDYSRSLVSSFSHIHNYLPTTLLPLVFALPFILWLYGRKSLSGISGRAVGLILGMLFALSSNVTPVAFLATLIIVVIYKLAKGQEVKLIKIATNWQGFAIFGIILSMIFMYLLGPGVSSYADGYNGSYVPIEQIISSPQIGIKSLIGNMVVNIRYVAPIFIILVLSLLVECLIRKKNIFGNQQKSNFGYQFSGLCLIFFTIHVLAVSQIDITTTSRILLPAYVFAVISVLFTINRLIILSEIKKSLIVIVSILVCMLTAIINIDMMLLMKNHQQQVNTTLQKIAESESQIVCVNQNDNPTARSPLMGYYQRELFMEWTLPANIDGKTVIWCE